MSINFSLEKLRSSDATETGRVKNSENAVTKSRTLESKSVIIELDNEVKKFFKGSSFHEFSVLRAPLKKLRYSARRAIQSKDTISRPTRQYMQNYMRY